MVSEGESGHQGHSDPPQPRQQGPQRRRHPAGRRSGRMKRARVVEDRAMQRAAKDPTDPALHFGMYDALGQGEGVMAAEAAREPLTIDAENRLAFIEPGSS